MRYFPPGQFIYGIDFSREGRLLCVRFQNDICVKIIPRYMIFKRPGWVKSNVKQTLIRNG